MALRIKFLVFAVACAASGLHRAAAVSFCPGESGRYGDHKCNHDQTHRVCAKLLDEGGHPLAWGSSGNFWQITHQEQWQWDDQIRANNGDSWCICMWATANLISNVGCDNVHLQCDATDVSFVMNAYSDGGVDLAPAKNCLMKKCPQFQSAQSPTAVNLRGIQARNEVEEQVVFRASDTPSPEGEFHKEYEPTSHNETMSIGIIILLSFGFVFAVLPTLRSACRAPPQTARPEGQRQLRHDAETAQVLHVPSLSGSQTTDGASDDECLE